MLPLLHAPLLYARHHPNPTVKLPGNRLSLQAQTEPGSAHLGSLTRSLRCCMETCQASPLAGGVLQHQTKVQVFASAELSCWQNLEQCPWLKVSENIYQVELVLQCLGSSLEHAPVPAMIPHLACPLSHHCWRAVGTVRAVSRTLGCGRARTPLLAVRRLHIYPAQSKVLRWKEHMQLYLTAYH